MDNLTGKNILLGITAGIAAYKTCELTRELKKRGANVTIIMTPNAKEFVSPLVLATLSNNKVHCKDFDCSNYDVEHISLAEANDIFVIAPATANTISKIANGICDNLLTSVACAFNKPFLIAPAMNNNMYENIATQENINKLKNRGYIIIEPEFGFLACGTTAKGRMSSIDNIISQIILTLKPKNHNKNILITAGGTKENIDPVRYIGNYSSGKMGIALADVAHKRGYNVTLVSTVRTDKPYKVLNVTTADEMLNAVKQEFINTDYLIMAAAVADYKPISCAEQKIKKTNSDKLILELTKNPDILCEVSKIKTDKQTIIGFCAESENLIDNATEKLEQKHLDYIIANDISRNDIGFSNDYNEVTIISKTNKKLLKKDEKHVIAEKIIEYCIDNKN